MNSTQQAQEALNLGVASKQMLTQLVSQLDADIVMLAKDEHAQNGGSTEKAERAANRLMAIVALVAPVSLTYELIDTTGGEQ